MEINWPSGPTIGQTYTSPNGDTWVWSGKAWISKGSIIGANYNEVTYNELITMINNSELVPGYMYAITHTTIHRIGYSEEINTGTPEKLILTAISNNQFDPWVVSADYPRDEIKYDPLITTYYNDWYGDEPCDGFITYRKDQDGNEGHFDIRNYKVEVWPAYTDRNNNTDLSITPGGYRQGYTFNRFNYAANPVVTRIRINIPSTETYDNSGVLQIGTQTLSSLGTTPAAIIAEIENQLDAGPNDPLYFGYANGTTGAANNANYIDILLKDHYEQFNATWTQNTDGLITIDNREVRYAIGPLCLNCKIENSPYWSAYYGGTAGYASYPNSIILGRSRNCSIGYNSEDCIISGESISCSIGNECLDINIAPIFTGVGNGDQSSSGNYDGGGSTNLQIKDGCQYIDVAGRDTIIDVGCVSIYRNTGYERGSAQHQLIDSYFAPGTEGLTLVGSDKLKWMLSDPLYCSIGIGAGTITSNVYENNGYSISYQNSRFPVKLSVSWTGGRYYSCIPGIDPDPDIFGYNYIQLSQVKAVDDIIRAEMESYYVGGPNYIIQFAPQSNDPEDWTTNTYTVSGLLAFGEMPVDNIPSANRVPRILPSSSAPNLFYWPCSYDANLLILNFNAVTYPLIGNEKIVINGTTYNANGAADELSYTPGTDAISDAAAFAAFFNLNPPTDYWTGWHASGKWIATDRGDGTVLLARLAEYEQLSEYRWPQVQILGGNYFGSLTSTYDQYGDNGPWYATKYLSKSAIIAACGTSLVRVRARIDTSYTDLIGPYSGEGYGMPDYWSSPYNVDINGLPF